MLARLPAIVQVLVGANLTTGRRDMVTGGGAVAPQGGVDKRIYETAQRCAQTPPDDTPECPFVLARIPAIVQALVDTNPTRGHPDMVAHGCAMVLQRGVVVKAYLPRPLSALPMSWR